MSIGESFIEVQIDDATSMVNVHIGNNRNDENWASIDLTPEQAAVVAVALNKAQKKGM